MPAITNFALMPKFILFLFFAVLSYHLRAQTWEVGVGAGGAGYIGDFNLTNPIKVSGPSFGIFVKRNFDGYLAIRASYNYGTISAADSNSTSQQFRNRNYTPYIFLGVAALDYVPSTIYQGHKYDLRPLETEGEKKPYPSTAFSIPYGAGFKYNVAGALTLGIELGYRTPNTGYLDDVSGYYANMSNAPAIARILADRSGEKTGVYIGTPGTERGNLSTHDTYFFTQLTISFTFLTQKCYYH
jgi:hypothetical protein